VQTNLLFHSKEYASTLSIVINEIVGCLLKEETCREIELPACIQKTFEQASIYKQLP